MNAAVAIALVAATVNFTNGVVHVAISRAPGWRVARASAVIAITAALYSALTVVFGLDGLANETYLAAGRATYVVATVHAVAWMVFAYGGPIASRRNLPLWVRRLVVIAIVAAAFFAITGFHLRDEVSVVDVQWAGVRYHYPLATTVGDVYGLLVTSLFGFVLVQLIQRVRRGERALRWHAAGFAVFVACTIDEVLVANRVVVFLSVADFGLVAVVLPLTIALVRRVIADARQLAEWSGQLEDQVRQRTEERDGARSALVGAERLAALGRLASGVGHEINNPLTYMQLGLDELDAHIDRLEAPPAARDAVATVRDGAQRIQKVVEGLRSYSRQEEELRPLDLRDVVRAAMKVASPQLRHLARVDTELGGVPLVLGDESRLVQVVVNLLTNAAQAIADRPAGRVVVATSRGEDGQARLVVRDDGPGIPPELITRLGEPYLTTRANSGGLGLGLFITRGIVDAHGGRLEFASEPGQGATVTIDLPGIAGQPFDESSSQTESVPVPESQPSPVELPFPPPTAASARPGAALRPGDVPEVTRLGRRVLLVDDEPFVVEMLARALGRSWDVRSAASGAEALRLVESEEFDVLVCDLMMPGMTGMEVAERLARTNPELRERTLFLTGGAVVAAAESFLAQPDVRHMTKPVSLSALDAALREMVES